MMAFDFITTCYKCHQMCIEYNSAKHNNWHPSGDHRFLSKINYWALPNNVGHPMGDDYVLHHGCITMPVLDEDLHSFMVIDSSTVQYNK